jgi:hypothetical protein
MVLGQLSDAPSARQSISNGGRARQPARSSTRTTPTRSSNHPTTQPPPRAESIEKVIEEEERASEAREEGWNQIQEEWEALEADMDREITA